MKDQAYNLRKMASGVADTAPQPAHTRAQSRLGTPANTRARSIAVTSGKGGVGKTNIALMLSTALASLNKKVLLFDADLGLANVHILLGRAPATTLAQVARDECDIKDVIIKGPQNIDIIPGASGIQQMANMDALGLGRMQRKLSSLEDNYHFIVMDTSAGIGAATTDFAAMADINVLVFTPEPTSFTDAYAMAKMLYECGAETILNVVNMVHSDKEGKETFDKLSAVVVKFLKRDMKLLGVLPFDRSISEHVRKQTVCADSHAKHKVYQRVHGFARRLCGYPTQKQAGFFARLFDTTATTQREGGDQ